VVGDGDDLERGLLAGLEAALQRLEVDGPVALAHASNISMEATPS
jgi:hypothetical protein